MLWKLTEKRSNNLKEQLLFNRGIATPKEINQFFHPKLSDHAADLKIPGIPKASKRILEAIKKGELIIIYGDYDVDGICASAILYKALSSLGARVLPYIPHREKEGYGLSKFGLEEVKKNGASLVITVDNGIVAYDKAVFAKELGLDLIITDHHVPGDKKPEAYTVIHSVKMCGASVAWCLIADLVKKDLAQELLQFAAIATVCDLIPLIGIGRAFVFEGLKILAKTNNPGLLALFDYAGIKNASIGSFEIGYIIGPRLNAMGRLEHAIESLRLLCTKDPLKAKRLARLLSETNAARQGMTLEAVEEARLLINHEKKIHVLASKNWSSGIIGLVAGRVCEEYWRPAIAISLGEEISKGSARSVAGINIVEAIRQHADILIDVGGHPGAAGFSLLSKNVDVFKKRLEDHIVILPPAERILEIEAQLEAGQLRKQLISEIEEFEPFGLGNKRPIFASYKMKLSDLRTVGEGKHLKGKADNLGFIAFGMGEQVSLLKNGQEADLAYTPELDTYNGQEKVQLKVKDIKSDH